MGNLKSWRPMILLLSAVSIVSIVVNLTLNTGLSDTAGILGCASGVLLIVILKMSLERITKTRIGFLGVDIRNFKKVLIVGAGSAGEMTIKEMRKHPEMLYIPVGLIDDCSQKLGKNIVGVKVLGNRNNIKEVVREKKIDEIIIAIPSLKGESRIELIRLCNETGCRTKVLPGIYELIDGKVTLNQIRNVDVENLLGREPVFLDCEGISDYLEGKRVLITGGGGSIGSELCRQISKFNPKQLLVLDFYENSVYDLYNEIKEKGPVLDLKVIIASITDRKRMEKVFCEYRPEIVFHAAAHKHVPLMEENPAEAIKNNVFGTLNTAECADKYGVKKFVMISTDKAVNPTNIMGASKRICEMIIQAMDRQSSTEFVSVRFGNVLGSNGSVVPLFKRQIAGGGPVTVTSEQVTRYFMTIPEAAQLVLQAGAYAEGGEIFVLDMGKPVRIYDLACDLIRLSGFEPHKDIEIEIIGLRPGEKLYEELLLSEEGLNTTRHKKIFVGKPTFSDMSVLRKSLDKIRFVMENENRDELICKIKELVPTYRISQNNCYEFQDEEIATTVGVKQ